MNNLEQFNAIKKLVHNQLRIHWHWLRTTDDWKEAFDFIESCMIRGIEDEIKN